MASLQTIKSELAPIKTETQYQKYLGLIDTLIDCPEDSPEEEVLELISVLVEDYESKHYPIEAPDSIDAIKFKMDEEGLNRKCLTVYFGSPSRMSELGLCGDTAQGEGKNPQFTE
jgi:HTH-type transcriptional regulator/antitoxin HigA